MKPIKLKSDNFTPITRTPWAGEAIFRDYKSHLGLENEQRRIGESWEISCDPAFPSMLDDESGRTLQQLIDSDPIAVLGPKVANSTSSCEILVKLLNASSPLSLQIHPSDDDPDLKDGECGKPESWYILDSEPGCGIYLGFNRELSKDELANALQKGAETKELMQFVETRAGDYFEIAPGVPHAIGPGVTLLEPQRILPGKSGKTYRLWDWGRKYDVHGNESLEGKGRELHIEQGLKLIDFENCHGESFLASLRKMPTHQKISNEIEINSFPPNPYYQTNILKVDGRSSFQTKSQESYWVAIVLDGEIKSETQMFRKGESFFVPASIQSVSMNTEKGTLAILHPSPTQLSFQ